MRSFSLAALVAVAVMALVCPSPVWAIALQLAPIGECGVTADLVSQGAEGGTVRVLPMPDLGPFELGPAILEVNNREVCRWKIKPYDYNMFVEVDKTYYVRFRVWRKGAEIGQAKHAWASGTAVIRLEPKAPVPPRQTDPPPAELHPVEHDELVETSPVSEDQLKAVAEEAWQAGFEAGQQEAARVVPTPPPPLTTRVVVQLEDERGAPTFGVVRILHAGGETTLQGTGQVEAEVPPGPLSVQVMQGPGPMWVVPQGHTLPTCASAGTTVVCKFKQVVPGVCAAPALSAEQVVRTANQAVRRELSAEELAWLTKYYGHHEPTLRMAITLAQYRRIEARGDVAWDSRHIASKYQDLTEEGRKLIEVVRALPKPQPPPRTTSVVQVIPPVQKVEHEVRIEVDLKQSPPPCRPVAAPCPEPRWQLQVAGAPQAGKVLVERPTTFEKWLGALSGPVTAWVGGRAIRPSRVNVTQIGGGASAVSDSSSKSESASSSSAAAAAEATANP